MQKRNAVKLLLVLVLSGCGITIGNGAFIMGTEAFLKTAQEGKDIEEHKETERAQLSRMIDR